MNRNWLMVIGAGVMEVAWVTGLKHSAAWWEWLLTIIAIVLSFDVLIRATRVLPIGAVYAVFTGLGTAGTVILEMIVFGEPFSWLKVLFILVLLTGVIGLKMVTKSKGEEAAAS